VYQANYTLILLFALSSVGIFGIIGSGWASNSKYALIGAIRSSAQMISYEIALGFVLLSLSFLSESVNISAIYFSQKFANFFPLFPLVFIFFIIALAETNRAPFDLPEAEAEIVAGYNIEYSGIAFSLFFLGEYSNMFIMSLMTTLFFFGSNSADFTSLILIACKSLFFASLFVYVRAALPRVRYDQLMYLG
jgi:NADH:ubiquinone oxidoreductase subunit H